MENASKALLIAAAILIAIMLIGLGILVLSGGQSMVESGVLQMTAQEKDMFNLSFSRYEGTTITGTNVRALIGNIMSSNSTNKEIEGKLVSITGDSTYTVTKEDLKTNSISAYRATINTGATYSVKLSYGNNGLVNSIEIKKNS